MKRELVPPRSEAQIVRAILQALNLLPGVFAFPMNVGAVQGEYKGKARYVRFGFKGLSDVIGWKREIFQWALPTGQWWETMGVPRFLALEVKRPHCVPVELGPYLLRPDLHKLVKTSGRARQHALEQAAFLEMVRGAGGIAAVVTSVEEAVEAVRG